MSVETAIGTSIGSAVGASMGAAVETGISGSIGPASSIGSAIETGLSTTLSPETLSGGMHKSISMAKIMATSVPYEVNSGSFNPDRVVPGAPGMVFDNRLFSTLAMPTEAPNLQTASSMSADPAPTASPRIQEFLLPESLRAEEQTAPPVALESLTRSVLVGASTRTDLYQNLDQKAVSVQSGIAGNEAIADQKLADALISQIHQLFPQKPEDQAFWENRVESAADIQSAGDENTARNDTEFSAAPSVTEEETSLAGTSTDTEMIVRSDSSDISEPPPNKPFEEKIVEPEPQNEKPPEEEEPVWNTYALQETWRSAKESLKRRVELARAIVGNAFSQESAIPAAQIAAEAPLLDLPNPAENLQIFRGKLRYPSVQREVQLRAIASGASYGQTDHAVTSVVYKNAPTEKHKVQRFLEQKAQSKLVMPAKKLAEAGAEVIVLKKRRTVWESAKSRVGIHPVEMERATQQVA